MLQEKNNSSRFQLRLTAIWILHLQQEGSNTMSQLRHFYVSNWKRLNRLE